VHARRAVRRSRTWQMNLLSWDSSACPGQLTGRRTIRPSIDIAPWRPLPRDVPAALRLSRVHLESPVPSLWFLTTSTASSARRLAGLLHPATDHEVRRVSCSCRPDTAGEGGLVRSRDPRGAHRTPRRMIPSDSRSASPRPLPSCRWRAAAGPPGVEPLPVRCSYGRRRLRRLQGLAPSSGP